MTEHKIHVYPQDSIYQEYKFTAVLDGYDGAPIDHETPSKDPIGYGDTEYEAMYDLLEKCL
jgi:hypothetical protein